VLGTAQAARSALALGMTWEDPTEWGVQPSRTVQRRYPNAVAPASVPMPITEKAEDVFMWVYVGLLAIFAWPLTLCWLFAEWERRHQQEKLQSESQSDDQPTSPQRLKAEGRNWL
jgi:hypothetical protein